MEARTERSPDALSPLDHTDQGAHLAGNQPAISLLREICFITVICCTQLLTQAAFGAVLAPLHVIAKQLHADTTGQTSWFLASYSLTVGTFVLIAGRLGDLYGHKRMVVFGWSWFGLWSLIAGFSAFPRSPILFDVCRALQGIGPAILLPNALAIVGRAYQPGQRKNMVFALFGATAPFGCGVGALIGSALAVHAWWPWALWLLAAACFSLSVLGYFAIPSEPPPTGPPGSSRPSFDTLGAVFGVTGLVLVNFAWNQAPITGWQTPYVYIILIIGVLFLIAFGLVERRVPHPLFPPGILTLDAICIMACLALGWSSFGVWIFYTFQFLQAIRHTGPVASAVQLIPEALSGLCAALVTGYLLGRVQVTWLMMAALSAFFAGCVLAATAPVHQTYWANIFLSMLIMPWGMDISFPASTLILSNIFPREHQGIAASLVNTIVNYSISIGLGIAGTLESRTDRDGRDALRGYRYALFTSAVLSGLGLAVSAAFALRTSSKKA